MEKTLRCAISYFQSKDIGITSFIKYITDLSSGLKFLGQFASPLFILLNIKSVIFSRNALICMGMLVPAFLLSPSIEVIRMIFSISILWIFFKKFETNKPIISNIMLIVSMLYAILIFSGIFYFSNYFVMGDGTLRYKFLLESQNALTVPSTLAFVFLVNGIFQQQEKQKLIRIASFIALTLLMIVFLLIKSRLYIGLSLGLIFIASILSWRKSWLPLIATIIYLLLFTGLTTSLKHLSNLEDDFGKIANSERIISTYGTGRHKLNQTFYELISEKGWQQFIYQNNAEAYTEKKRAIPGLKMSDSTLTENTYFVTILYAGFLGLAALLITSACLLLSFLKRKEYCSSLYFFLIMGVWCFEETTLFPLSLIAQLFALLTINLLEKNRINENRISN